MAAALCSSLLCFGRRSCAAYVMAIASRLGLRQEGKPHTRAMSSRTRPVEKFARATAQCSAEATAYGRCIVADYTAVHKDMCAREFMKLKDCYLAASKKR